MSNPDVSAAVDDVSVAARALEVPDADFTNGMNVTGSNAPGIGINIAGGAVIGTPEQFTLNDQDNDARTPQVSQLVGGAGYINRGSVAWPSSGGVEGKGVLFLRGGPQAAAAGDGTITFTDNLWLQALSGGWIYDPTP